MDLVIIASIHAHKILLCAVQSSISSHRNYHSHRSLPYCLYWRHPSNFYANTHTKTTSSPGA